MPDIKEPSSQGITPGEGKDITDNVAEDHASGMSPPQEHAINAENAELETKQTNAKKDVDGNIFDPEKHMVDSDNNPVTTKDGRWRRRPGRKAGQEGARRPVNSQLNPPGTWGPGKQGPGQEGHHQADHQADNYRASAEATVDGIGMLGQMLGGNEWIFQRVVDEKGNILADERASGVNAFERLYREKGITDIPPGVAVVIWGLSYAAPRLMSDKSVAKDRMAKGWIWLRSKLRRKPKKAEPESDTDKNEGKKK